jgi:broad specificity phosphatase PhoE
MNVTFKLVRHGESEANINKVLAHEIGDHAVMLSARGEDQARQAGAIIGTDFLRGALLYVSPYRRTRQTLDGILRGSGMAEAELSALRTYEDPRLREVEHGYTSVKEQHELRRLHGWFYYRFSGGESPADCFDRTSSFLESMMRQVERKRAERVLIVTHGLTIRCFVMRFLHLTVETFDSLATVENCDIVTLGPKDTLTDCLFTSGRWGVTGLRLRKDDD